MSMLVTHDWIACLQIRLSASSAFDWYCGNGSAIASHERITHALFPPSPERHPAITNFWYPVRNNYPFCRNESPTASTIDRLHSLHCRYSCHPWGMFVCGVKEMCSCWWHDFPLVYRLACSNCLGLKVCLPGFSNIRWTSCTPALKCSKTNWSKSTWVYSMIVFVLLSGLVLTINMASTMATCGTHGGNFMKTPEIDIGSL